MVSNSRNTNGDISLWYVLLKNRAYGDLWTYVMATLLSQKRSKFDDVGWNRCKNQECRTQKPRREFSSLQNYNSLLEFSLLVKLQEILAVVLGHYSKNKQPVIISPTFSRSTRVTCPAVIDGILNSPTMFEWLVNFKIIEYTQVIMQLLSHRQL